MKKVDFSIEGVDPLLLLGYQDSNLNLIQKHFNSLITVRGDRIIIKGDNSEVKKAKELFSILLKRIGRNRPITHTEIELEIERIKGIEEGSRVITPKLSIRPKSKNQKDYLEAMDNFDLVIGIGPAGTGKTYLAVAKAVASLMVNKVTRIILTRPAVEAGESLGYLPGSFKEKVDPYLRPLYDALYEMVPLEKVRRFIDEGTIEVAPLAYMRGRTLSDSCVILDEAQNTTSGQMKMFLTRLGWNSKAVVTGDITQIDLSSKKASGLVGIQTLLKGIPRVRFIYFDEEDVVRPPLVSAIIRAYESEKSSKV